MAASSWCCFLFISFSFLFLLFVCLSLHSVGVSRVDIGSWPDVNVFAGALKLYLRELPEPLFSYALYEPFVQAARKALFLSPGVYVGERRYTVYYTVRTQYMCILMVTLVVCYSHFDFSNDLVSFVNARIYNTACTVYAVVLCDINVNVSVCCGVERPFPSSLASVDVAFSVLVLWFRNGSKLPSIILMVVKDMFLHVQCICLYVMG